ncbi:hypothetical protein BDV26DRAFT_260407 [Aspergillus bertholletiae]|uniref:Uncharacterized protein n=1 Tax=Aspergillus bertholletiae TaxID=1226010 RepID=A0A5N7BB80_9EURO|nr:hypothetical protein BDV26DRAFT_260407 [Aspergillus bertholletiae]
MGTHALNSSIGRRLATLGDATLVSTTYSILVLLPSRSTSTWGCEVDNEESGIKTQENIKPPPLPPQGPTHIHTRSPSYDSSTNNPHDSLSLLPLSRHLLVFETSNFAIYRPRGHGLQFHQSLTGSWPTSRWFLGGGRFQVMSAASFIRF